MGIRRDIGRIRRNRNDATPVPVVMQINITSMCPCRCWHCELAENRQGRHLSWEFLGLCQLQAAEWDCTVLYSGGEPLAYPRWREMLHNGRRLGLRQKLITSGAGLERLDDEDRHLLSAALAELLISVDAAEPDRHDTLRGVRGLHRQVVDYLDGPQRPPAVWLVHVPPADFTGVDAMIGFARRFKVGLAVQPYSCQSNFPSLEPLAAKAELKSHMPRLAESTKLRARQLADMARKQGVPTNLEEVAGFVGAYYRHCLGDSWYGREVLPAFSCSVPWQQITIDEQERIQPCTFLPGSPIPAGMTLATHWHNLAIEYRDALQRGRVWPQCHACSCHFGMNFRNSIYLSPWTNRGGVLAMLRKQLAKRLGLENRSRS